MKYQSYSPNAYFQDSYSDAVTADEIIIPNQPDREYTGVLDEYGNPIYKVWTNNPVGFDLG